MAPNQESANTAKHRATTIYVAVGVVVGIGIVCFIGCMMMIRHLIALKDRVKQKMGRRAAHSIFEAEEMNDGLRLTTKTPDTELESQVSLTKGRSSHCLNDCIQTES